MLPVSSVQPLLFAFGGNLLFFAGLACSCAFLRSFIRRLAGFTLFSEAVVFIFLVCHDNLKDG